MIRQFCSRAIFQTKAKITIIKTIGKYFSFLTWCMQIFRTVREQKCFILLIMYAHGTINDNDNMAVNGIGW